MLGIPMVLSGVGTLETEVTKPLSAVEKVTMEKPREHIPVGGGTEKVCEIPLF